MAAKPGIQMGPITALLATASFWGVLWFPLRWLSENGLPGLWAILVMFSSALLIGLPWLWRWRGLMLQRPGLLVALAIASGWCNTAFILAVLDGEVVRVMLLFYLSPVWAVVLAYFLLGERPPPAAVITLLVALSGALVILWQPSLGVPWPQGAADWLAISAGFAFGLSNVLVRKGADLPVSVKTVIAWVGVIVMASVMIMVVGGGGPIWDMAVIGFAATLGMFGMASMSWLLVYGVSRLPVHRSAVILLFEVVVGAISAHWLAGEVMGGREWIGGFLILIAAWLASRHSAV